MHSDGAFNGSLIACKSVQVQREPVYDHISLLIDHAQRHFQGSSAVRPAMEIGQQVDAG